MVLCANRYFSLLLFLRMNLIHQPFKIVFIAFARQYRKYLQRRSKILNQVGIFFKGFRQQHLIAGFPVMAFIVHIQILQVFTIQVFKQVNDQFVDFDTFPKNFKCETLLIFPFDRKHKSTVSHPGGVKHIP